MQQAVTIAGGRRRAASGLSLGAKFVGLAGSLILLLSVSAYISLHTSASTVDEIHSVVEFAIPAYGALARGHIRSLEQGLELRRALLLAEDPTAGADALRQRLEAFHAATAGFEQETATAARLLVMERDNERMAVAVTALQPLIEGLAEIDRLSHRYHAEAETCMAAVQRHGLAQGRSCLAVVDLLRDDLNARLETLRSGLFAVLETVSQQAQAAQSSARMASLVVFVLAAVLGLGVAAIGAARLIRSIRSVVQGAEAVERGDLETRIEIASRDEIGRLAASFNRMTEGLRMRDRIRDLFGRYVDPRVAEQLIGPQAPLSERGERREVAVMFCDLAGFTALSERVEPEQLVTFLNAHFALILQAIAASGGIIDKYLGDGVMAYWCAPFVPPGEVAPRSAEAALGCLAQLPAIAEASRRIFGPDAGYVPRLHIGLDSGEAITGSIGAEQRRNYTVIGDTVNHAARIEEATRLYDVATLVSARAAAAIGDRLVLREVDSVPLAGIAEPQPLYEILGRTGAVPLERLRLAARYAEALAAWRRGNLAGARTGFQDCLALAPDDGPSEAMLSRLRG
jgi:adenylate cyclase